VNQDPHPRGVSSGLARLKRWRARSKQDLPLTEGEFSLAGSRPTRYSLLTLCIAPALCDTPKRQRVSARDLDSRNSTFVNNVPVKERLLADGDQIRVGKSMLYFKAAQEPSVKLFGGA